MKHIKCLFKVSLFLVVFPFLFIGTLIQIPYVFSGVLLFSLGCIKTNTLDTIEPLVINSTFWNWIKNL